MRLLSTFLFIVFIAQNASAQETPQNNGLLWKISGNGLTEPSYLYGTMHVSNRVAFHLSETFFKAIEEADIVALEGNPEFWINEITSSALMEEMSMYSRSTYQPDLYGAFIPYQPNQIDLGTYLAREDNILNSFLWRTSGVEQNFEEQTYLDLFIFQAGKKAGKKVVALEDFDESMAASFLANKYDKDAKRVSARQAQNILGDFNNWFELQEDAYRKGDLDKLDTITSIVNPGKYYRTYMLNVRNAVMATGIDSMLQDNRLFIGVGAAHLPGKMGVINMLRNMGYTVEPEPGAITKTSIDQKDVIDKKIYTYPSQWFTSDDGLLKTKIPQQPTKIAHEPYQEYLFADMANGAFYSIRRVPTKQLVYGKTTEMYRAKVDSLLFENIPGKITSTDSITVSGYPALEIKNKTKLGDLQRYRIIFTPLEIIILRVGGHHEFAESEQPTAFFDAFEINTVQYTAGTYSPNFGAFSVWLPAGYRSQNYISALERYGNTFEVEAADENNAYYSVKHHQYHDFEYIEEDYFELEYIVDKLVADKKLSRDTAYQLADYTHPAMAFVLKNKADQPIYGQVHISGPNYYVLLTTGTDAAVRDHFFQSFKPASFTYATDFTTQTDSVFHFTINTPARVNGYDNFIYNLVQGSRYGEEEDTRFEGEEREKLIVSPTGEVLSFKLTTLHKYESYKELDEFWEEFKRYNFKSFNEYQNKLVSQASDSSYLKQVREIWYTDTNSTRAIRCKLILQNQALYSLTATADTLGYSSAFVDSAFASFSVTTDTLIGTSILQPKNDLFFTQLESQDSVAVFEAVESLPVVTFDADDFDHLNTIFKNFKYKGFNREARLYLLEEMANLDDERAKDYLINLYAEFADSSAYQFAILEALAGIRTKESTRAFTKLILEETPFTKDQWGYNSLFWDFRDSVELVQYLLPDILELTDFTEYRDAVYTTISIAVYKDALKAKHIKKKYESILRLAKVELKKQKTADQDKSESTMNNDLNKYTRILTLFANKKDVQQFFADELTIKNKGVLSDVMQRVNGYVEIPDSLWNYIAKERRELVPLYEYLEEKGELDRLAEQYRNQQALAEGFARMRAYEDFDTISLITTKPVELKGGPAMAYFFRVKFEEADFDQLMYVVFNDEPNKVLTDTRLTKKGEEFSLEYDDLDEILKDAQKEIKEYKRNRVVEEYGDYYDYDY